MFKLILKFILVTLGVLAYVPSMRPSLHLNRLNAMTTITNGVEFDTIAREWRMKWSPDNDKKSLASAQQTLAVFQGALKKIDGVKSVQRVVCGGCLDFKVVVALPTEKFKEWEGKSFAPETDILAAFKAIPGISNIETQTYTLMPVL